MDGNVDQATRRLFTNRRLAVLVVVAVVLALLVLFVADNFVLVEIRLIVTRVEMRLAWALLIAALGGSIIGFVSGRFLR